MFKTSFVTITLIICNANIWTTSTEIIWAASLFEMRIGARNFGGKLGTFTVKSSIQCSLSCAQHTECNSFNLGPVGLSSVGSGGGNRRSCELVKTDHNSLASISEEAGWTFAIGE